MFNDVAAVVRKGGTVAGEHGTLGPDNPLWVEFARSMMPLVTPAAEVIVNLVNADPPKKWKVLDVAAGLGLFGIALARHNPNAQIVALDWANVLEVAKENARRQASRSVFAPCRAALLKQILGLVTTGATHEPSAPL